MAVHVASQRRGIREAFLTARHGAFVWLVVAMFVFVSFPRGAMNENLIAALNPTHELLLFEVDLRLVCVSPAWCDERLGAPFKPAGVGLRGCHLMHVSTVARQPNQ
jgi:hypothetical protein